MYLFDPLIRELVKQGADMAVNLAAGLDTGPYRMRLPASLNWIEVDSPEILDYKEELLKRAMPAGSLERGRLDFSHAEIRCSLFGGLAGRAANALVITEGLLIYGGWRPRTRPWKGLAAESGHVASEPWDSYRRPCSTNRAPHARSSRTTRLSRWAMASMADLNPR